MELFQGFTFKLSTINSIYITFDKFYHVNIVGDKHWHNLQDNGKAEIFLVQIVFDPLSRQKDITTEARGREHQNKQHSCLQSAKERISLLKFKYALRSKLPWRTTMFIPCKRYCTGILG
jgi:hypothetical protein